MKYVDITGQKFNHLTVVKMDETAERGGGKSIIWICKCDCGNFIKSTYGDLVHGYKKSCGCQRYARFDDLSGKKFNRLTVIKLDSINNKKERVWLCKCDCGNFTKVPSYALTHGKTRSCGCYQIDMCKKANCKYNNYYHEGNYYCGVFADGTTFKIDEDDIDLAKKYYWVKDVNGYAITAKPYKGKSAYRLHRLIMNAPDGLVVDHINHDKSDNRKQNLRLCTLSQNAMNTRNDPKRNLPKGICVDKRNGLYIAQITKDYKNIHLGSYENLSDAISARRKAEDELFGEFKYNKEQDCGIKTG